MHENLAEAQLLMSLKLGNIHKKNSLHPFLRVKNEPPAYPLTGC